MLLNAAFTGLSYAKNWSPATHDWYISRLTPFICWLQDRDIQHIEDITAPLCWQYIEHRRDTPKKDGKPIDSFTLHGHVRAMRTLLKWAADMDLLDEKVFKRVKLPRRDQKVLQILDEDQIARLFRAAEKTDTPARDVTILSLLLDTGCRASEICGLTLDDVTFTPVAAWILVHGKGRKDREVALGRIARRRLYNYIHQARKASPDEQHVFVGRKGPLTPIGLDRLLYRLRDTAGPQHFKNTTVAAHRWRHTHAVRALQAGDDIYTLSRQMGHSAVAVTEGYLKAVTARSVRDRSKSVLDRV